MEPKRRRRLVNGQFGLPPLSRRYGLMWPAIGSTGDDQPVPMHCRNFRDVVVDARDHLLAAPQSNRRSEIGSVDAEGWRLALAQKPHRAGSDIEPDHPRGICSEFGRDRQRRSCTALCTDIARAELGDCPGGTREKQCSARELHHHVLHARSRDVPSHRRLRENQIMIPLPGPLRTFILVTNQTGGLDGRRRLVTISLVGFRRRDCSTG
jgi:hypothetical protein